MAVSNKKHILRVIYLGFGMVIFMTLILAITTVVSLNENHKTLEKIVKVNNVKTELIHIMQLAARNRMLTLDAIALEKDAFTQDENVQQFHKYAGEFVIARQKLMTLNPSVSEKKLLQQQYLSSIKAVEIQGKVLELALAEKQKDAINLLINEAVPAQNITFNSLDNLVQEITQYNHEEENKADTQSKNSLRLIIISLIIVILLSLTTVVFIQRRTSYLFKQLDLKSTELYYQKLAIDEHAIVSIANKRGDIIYVNEKFQDISQYSEEELLGQNHRLLKSDFHNKDFFRQMWRTIAKGEPWHGEIKNRAKDGSFYWVATTIMPLIDKQGKPERYISMRTDISNVKQAEVDLLNANNELENRVDERTAALNKVNIEIEHEKKVVEVVTKSTLNVKGEVFFKTLVNCMAAAMNVRCALVAEITDLESENAHAIALWAKDHFQPEFNVHMPDAPSYNLLTDSLAYFPAKTRELFPKMHFLTEHEIEGYVAVPFHNSNGELSGFIAILDDKPIVGIHKLRHLLNLFAMRAGAELERQTNEKALADAYQHKSEFLASMSHELRTPLNAIIGFSKLLLNGVDGPINDGQIESLNLIHDGGKHLLTLISEILDMSKLESGKIEIQTQVIELPIFIGDVVKNVSSLVNEKNLQLLTELNTQVVNQACFDPMRIKQVLLNILSNAIKFTQHGQINIICGMVDDHIDLLPERRQQEIKNSETAYLLIAITDTGVGISADNLGVVFDDFRQVDGSSTRQYGGTGLGLAISRRLVELHHGEIWAKSTVGEGSTFAFILPVFGFDEKECETDLEQAAED